jgi:hypothetical protein
LEGENNSFDKKKIVKVYFLTTKEAFEIKLFTSKTMENGNFIYLRNLLKK